MAGEQVGFVPTSETRSRFTPLLEKAQNSSAPTRKFTQADWVLPVEETIARKDSFPKQAVVFDSNNITETGTSTHFFNKEWLLEEIGKENQKSEVPGKTPWYHLPGTGFRVKEQVDQLIRNTAAAKEEDRPVVIGLELAKVTEDIKHFEMEYLKQMQSLKFNLAWGEVEGEQKVVCPDYGNVTWESVTDKSERDGAVAQALFGNRLSGEAGVEERLRQAPPNTFAIIVSPEGWSGLHDADGSEITFPGAQVYAIKTTENGGLQAHTFRYDASLQQTEAFQRSLGLEVLPTREPKERIKNILKNVGYFSSEDIASPIKSFEDIIKQMQESVGGRETTMEDRTFAEVRLLLSNPDAFNQNHHLLAPLVEAYHGVAKDTLTAEGSPEQIRKSLEKGLGIIISRFGSIYNFEQKMTKKGIVVNYADESQRWEILGGMNNEAALKDLQDLPGCAGGGKKRMQRMGTATIIAIGGGEGEWFSCSECGWQATGPIGESACGGCGFTKAQYAEKYGVACD